MALTSSRSACDFEEKLYSVGKIPGGFIKREGRPTEQGHADLPPDRPSACARSSPRAWRNDVQVVATVLSVDTEPAAGSSGHDRRKRRADGFRYPLRRPDRRRRRWVLWTASSSSTPTTSSAKRADLHLTVAGTKDAVMMVEAGANEVSEETMLDGHSLRLTSRLSTSSRCSEQIVG